MRVRCWMVPVAMLVCAGCGGTSSSSSGGGYGASGGLDAGGGSGGSAAGGSGGGSGGSGAVAGSGGVPTIDVDSGSDGSTLPPGSELYVHSNTTLYKGDPSVTPLVLERIGDFDCIGGPGEATSMTDIAVNADGQIWTISTTRIYQIEIQGSTVHCASSVPLNNPQGIRFYALTFAPRGVLDPNKEVLVAGNSAGELWSIDDAGNLTLRGNFGSVPPDDGNGNSYAYAGQLWELSGDLVFFANQGSPIGFATVRDCPNPPSTTGCSFVDTLIEIDVPALATATTNSVTKSVRGQVVKRADCTDTRRGYGSVYGIAGYQGKVLGFSRQNGNGFAIDIENTDGTACLIESFAGEPWAGAGITTVAPVRPPPPR